jgi:multidrug transporter EmrE-like cation transporter
MSNFGYATLFIVMLAALLAALAQMGMALDEADIGRFSIWTGIASVIAGLPMILW